MARSAWSELGERNNQHGWASSSKLVPGGFSWQIEHSLQRGPGVVLSL